MIDATDIIVSLFPKLAHVTFSWQAKARIMRKGRDLDNMGPSEVSAPCLTWSFTTFFLFTAAQAG